MKLIQVMKTIKISYNNVAKSHKLHQYIEKLRNGIETEYHMGVYLCLNIKSADYTSNTFIKTIDEFGNFENLKIVEIEMKKMIELFCFWVKVNIN